MQSLTIRQIPDLLFSADDIATLRRLGEFQGRQQLFVRQRPEVLQALRTVARVESSESSNRLEGIEAPKGRIEGLVLHQLQPKNRSEQEIAGYRDALDLIHESARAMPLASNLLLQLHKTLYGYLPQEGGRWKMVDNEIVERGPDGEVLRVRFVPVPAILTPHAVDNLTEAYREALAEAMLEPLVLIPAFVFDFLCIHPFTDGNGRIARLLTLMLLYQSDYDVGRYISLERHFERASLSYYETLETSSRGWHKGIHDPFPWIRYFWGVLLRAYTEFEERVGTVTTGRGSKTRQVQAAIGRKVQLFAISELQRDCPGVSKEMIRRVLRQMRDQGLLVLDGKGRGARWQKTGTVESGA